MCAVISSSGGAGGDLATAAELVVSLLGPYFEDNA